MYCGTNKNLNNSGFSLVELIVAISVGVVISGALASIIVISTRMYSRETTNIAEQYEIQATMNMTVDSAENAQWFALGEVKDGVATEYVAFGKLSGSNDANSVSFTGEIFTTDHADGSTDKFNVYMNRYTESSPLAIGKEGNAQTVIPTVLSGIRKKQYLLGEGATSFVVKLADTDKRLIDSTAVKPLSDGTVPKGFFENPLMVIITMDFERASMTGDIKKHLEDKVTFRNRIKRPVYLSGKGYYVQNN